jgi:hypothetical protein
MNGFSLFKMTAHENYKGQILWMATGVGLITLTLMALVSESAINHQSRLVDVASYFLVDIVSMITAMFVGSFLYSRDFSNRGIAELAIPSGISRIQLFFWRWLAHSLCLFLFLATLYLVRLLAFAIAASSTPTLLSDTALMFLFSTLKSILAFTLAASLGCFARPVIALIGSVGLFAIGHFSAGLQGIHGMIEDSRLITPFENFLYKSLRVWNPNALSLESLKGSWEQPGLAELALRCGWGLAAIAMFLSIAFLAVRNRDIGAMDL